MKMRVLVFFLIGLSCLFLRVESSSRIIGGKQARQGQFPYIAAIWATFNQRRLFCAGTLIDPGWILTAGHCVDGAIMFQITLGATNLKNYDSERVDVFTETYVLHPRYNNRTLENDIGLIRLRIPVITTIYLRPIELLDDHNLQANTAVIAVGWGSPNNSIVAPIDHLNYVSLRAISNVECRNYYGNVIQSGMVCVTGNSQEGTCRGDSGGPLLEHVGFAIYRLVGVSSFLSTKGCETKEPSGYTRTSTYLSWIKGIVLIP